MTRVVWANVNPEADARGSWDQGIVEQLTAGYEHVEMWRRHGAVSLGSGFDIERGAVWVIPGQHNRKPQWAEMLANMIGLAEWSLVIVTSDEEALFPVELLPHDDKHLIWGQYHARPEFDRVIPIGLPPDTKREHWRREITSGSERDLDVFFAGQNTHARREELIDVMKDMATEPGHGNISWVASTGFRAGLPRDDYLACMARTRIAPCPSGYHSLDSFRLYEAIAAGALPIIETDTPDGEEGDFWDALFGPERPIPRLASWTEGLPMLVDDYRDDEIWREERDSIARWYADYRADLAADFSSTIARLQS